LRLASRPVRPFSRKEAEQRDYHEIDNIEKGGPIAIADYTVVNDQGREKLQKTIDRLLEQAIKT
jgi:dephospho-CoA kinase